MIQIGDAKPSFGPFHVGGFTPGVFAHTSRLHCGWPKSLLVHGLGVTRPFELLPHRRPRDPPDYTMKFNAEATTVIFHA
ncbi:MAG TPA: hypothetical protein VF772_20370, partial [Terriglobales bacterium]